LSGAVTGRPVSWRIGIGAAGVIVSWLLGMVAGRVAADVRVWLHGPDARYRAVALFALAQVFVLLVVVLWKGTTFAVRRVTAVAAAVAIVVGIFMVGTGLGSGEAPVAALLLVLVTAAILLMGIFARIAAGAAAPWLFYVSAIGGSLVGREAGGGVLVTAMAIVAALTGRRALRRKGFDPWISRWADEAACLGGTRFRGADLTGAKLHGAMLQNSDFRDVSVDDSQFEHVSKMESCVLRRRPIADERPHEEAP
jgi:hypothetical protein